MSEMDHLHDDDPEVCAATFLTQANALFRKSLAFQKRRWKTNLLLVSFPGFLCVLLLTMQIIINSENNKPVNKCGCVCLPLKDGSCKKVCGVEYSTSEQAITCAVPSPFETPAMLQLPGPQNQAVNLRGMFPGFPEPSCRNFKSCPFVFLYTSQNRSFANALVNDMLTNNPPSNVDNPLSTLLPGTDEKPPKSYYLDPALPKSFTLLSSNCSSFPYSRSGIECSSTMLLWRNSTKQIEQEIYSGFRRGNMEGYINEIPLAYAFDETSSRKLDVVIFYNLSIRGRVTPSGFSPILRVPRSMNLAAEAFLRTITSPLAELPLSFLKEMPKPETELLINFSVLLGPIFFMWVVQLLFPVILISLVYEKEANLRMMMKMHGLGDGPYWFINYVYHLIFSMIYIAVFIAVGTIIGLDYFRKNDYLIQFIFYFVFMNLQIALAFFSTALFSSTITATVCGYLYVFGFGLLGGFLFEPYINDNAINRKFITALELFPGFSLYRGLYEFSQYSLLGINQGTKGMQWRNLWDDHNGLKEVLVIMACEWLAFLCLSLVLDQALTSDRGFIRFLGHFPRKKSAQAPHENDLCKMKPDVYQEMKFVEGLRSMSRSKHYCIICDDLRKTYPGRDGNQDMHAVRGLSFAVQRGECFGMLGPNGAGKTTSIKLMIGLLPPCSGETLVAGLELSKNLDKICTIMGVCPQHDLLWETLTGREHLLFYGRLKNLKGPALESEVKMSLKNVSLLDGGVPDKLAGNYSGGMKRRLSVAISLIGQTKAVYMDEPSTGLDPASRRTLWNAIKRAKQDRAIILTTHSMEEAEALCDRVGIFVNGQLECIGTCKELKSRYGGSYVFTVTGDPLKEETVARLVRTWSVSSKRIYTLSGTQKFEISKKDISLAKVFRDVEHYKTQMGITAWGLTDSTLEDVFHKVVHPSNQL